MNRIQEIEARLAAIANECESASGDALAALENEANTLTEERTRLMAEIEARNALRSRIAAGAGVAVPAAAPAPAAEPRQSVEDAEVRSFAGFLRGTLTEMRTGEINYDVANNGAVIPSTIANRIIEAVRDMCPILAGATMYHVKGTLNIPVYGPKTITGDSGSVTHDITVSYGADFSELTADAGAFTSISLGGYLVGALTLVGRTLQNNSDIDLVSFVVQKMAEKISVFIENELLNGTGADNSHCTGALNTTNALAAGSTSAITADKLIELQAKVKQAYQANAVWTMHPDTFTAIKKLKDQNNRYLIQDDFTGAFPYRLLGKPVYISDNMPTVASAAKAVLYGDYSGLSVNMRENISVEVLREKYATQHAIGVVAWFEMDSKITEAGKLATLVMSNSL